MIDTPSALAWLQTIATARILISGRFHHTIAAAVLGTPSVTFSSNTPKIEEIRQTLGLEPPLAFDGQLAGNLRERIVHPDRAGLITARATIEDMTKRAELNFGPLLSSSV